MSTKFDYKKEWEKTKKQLHKLGQEVSVLAKKGEEEFIKFSHLSKLQMDAATTNLKIEKLYYLIGKEYVNGRSKSAPSAKMNQYLKELDDLIKAQKSIKTQLNSKAKASTKKTTRAKKKTTKTKKSS